MSSNYSGTDTHGLMTSALSVPAGKEAPPRRSQALHGGTAIPDVAAGMEHQWCTTILCPGCQLQVPRDPAMDDGRPGWKEPVCWRQPSHATGQPSWKLNAEVRDSSQSRGQPHTGLFLHNLMLHQIQYLNFEKGFQHTTHTELTSGQCHYSWLRQLIGWV